MALIVVILGAAFTAWCVDASFNRGNLSSIPNYDDVTYFLSATKVLEAFRSSGFHGVADVIHQRAAVLHSPYSTMLAAAAFATLGYNDSSPYIFNFLAILLYLFFLCHILRDLPLTMRCAMMVFFLTLPFATMAVVEFRPDLCWATLVGFCAVFGVSSRAYFDDWRQPAIHALLFALSLLVKPSIFAMTIVVFGLSVCYQMAMALIDRRELSWRVIAKFASIYMIVSFVIAGPYFIFFGVDIWDYFLKNLFGSNKEIWAYQGDWLHQAGYYLAGGAAASNLGYSGWIAGCFFLTGTVAAIVRRDAAGMKLAGGLWGIVIPVYLINSLVDMKSPFVGAAFYSILIFASACLWNNAVSAFLLRHPQSKRIWTAGMIALAVFSMMLYQWPQHSGRMASPLGRDFKYVGERVISAISGLPLPKNPMIVFTQSGPVICENIEMWFAMHNIPISIINMSCFHDLAFERVVSGADLIFLQDPGMMGAFLRLPFESLQAQLRRMVSADSRFKLIKTIKALDGKYIYIYVNKRRIAASIDSGGTTCSDQNVFPNHTDAAGH